MLENLFNFSKQYLLLSLPWLTSLMLSSSAYQIITFREYSRSYHNPQALWSSYNYGCFINTCSDCEFKCPSRCIDFYTDGIAFPVENKIVTWWTIVLCFWIRSVISAVWMMAILPYSTLLPSSNTTSMLSMLQLSSSMDYDNFRWSPQSSTDGWSLSVELNHNDSVLAIEITFEDFVEDMSNICYRSETWISASLVVSIFRHAWPPTCEAKSKIICIWGNVLANFTNSATHFFFFRQNTRFPSTFLEKFPEKFELQTCGNKKKFTKPNVGRTRTHFGCREDSFWFQVRQSFLGPTE